jgi:hypothetical protein
MDDKVIVVDDSTTTDNTNNTSEVEFCTDPIPKKFFMDPIQHHMKTPTQDDTSTTNDTTQVKFCVDHIPEKFIMKPIQHHMKPTQKLSVQVPKYSGASWVKRRDIETMCPPSAIGWRCNNVSQPDIWKSYYNFIDKLAPVCVANKCIERLLSERVDDHMKSRETGKQWWREMDMCHCCDYTKAICDMHVYYCIRCEISICDGCKIICTECKNAHCTSCTAINPEDIMSMGLDPVPNKTGRGGKSPVCKTCLNEKNA